MLRYKIAEKINQQFGRFVTGSPIWDREWDICCILDACRADTYQEVDEDADEYWSVASSSKYWLERTFGDRDTSSVGYISANPFAAGLDENQFGYSHLEPVTMTSHGIETVDPETLRDHAVSAWRQRDDLGIDQLVVHFMQPHVPFRSKPEWFGQLLGTETWGSHLAYRVGNGEIKRSDWMDAYRDNLAWVLDEGVHPMTDLVDGTVGITADHGNALGEWGLFGHPRGVAVPAVRKVPWQTLEASRIRDDFEPVELGSQTLTDEQTREQLEALGYR